MIRTIGKTAAGLSVILASTLLLSACNTVHDTASGVQQTAYGVDQTVTGAAVGAQQDVKAVVAHKYTSKHQMMDDQNHEPAG